MRKKIKDITKRFTCLVLSLAITLPTFTGLPWSPYIVYADETEQTTNEIAQVDADGIYFDGQWIVGVTENYEYITEYTYNKYNCSAANNAYWTSLSSSGGRRPDGTPYAAYNESVSKDNKLQTLSAWYGQTVYFREKGTEGVGTAVSIPKYSDLGDNQYKTAIRVFNVRATDVSYDYYGNYIKRLYNNTIGSYAGIGENINISFNNTKIETFNTNAKNILTDAEGNYIYDLVVIGPYSGTIADISDVAAWVLKDYINEGYGLLVGHDALYGEPGVTNSAWVPSKDSTTTKYYDAWGDNRYGTWNINWLVGANKLYTNARPYETASLLLSSSSRDDKGNNKGNIFGNSTGNYSWLQIATKYNGNPETDLAARCPTNYPYKDINTSFLSGLTHTNNQLTYGTVWVDFYNSGTYGKKITDKNEGLTGTNNFYLTTNGNVGMIQAGHVTNASAVATAEEAKLLTNTILYLSQRETCSICESGQNGYNKANSVIRISSVEELDLIGEAGYEITYPIDGCYVLTSDIEFPTDWEPILNFSGHFNANNFNVINHGKPMFDNGTKSITVTYNANGGKFGINDTNTVVFVNNELKDGIYQVPTRAEAEFLGWYTDKNCTAGNEFDVNKAAANITVYAKWDVEEYTYNVKYVSETGIELGTSTITKAFGDTFTITPKAFTGYKSPSSKTVVWDSAEPKTITFEYSLIEYQITYDLSGGSAGEFNRTSYNIETPTFELNIPVKNNYMFIGWTGSNGGTPDISVSIEKGSTGAKTYTANWDVGPTVTYIANGGVFGTNATNAVTYKEGTATSQSGTYTEPTRKGYNFKGWYLDDTYTTKFTPNSDIPSLKENISVYAKWEIVTYTISYNLNGGEFYGNVVEKYTVETDTFNLPTPTRIGYTFGGWHETSNFSGSAVTQIAKGSTGNKTFYAKWTANTNTKYTVKHYQMDLDGTNYTLKDTDNLTSTTAASVTPAVKTYTGFTAPSTQTVTIAADGSTVVEYKYTRNKYYLDVNGLLNNDNLLSGKLTGYGTVDAYVNGNKIKDDVSDVYWECYYGSTFEITDIKALNGRQYKGVHVGSFDGYEGIYVGSLTGTIDNDRTIVVLKFSTITYNISYNLNGGTVNTANPTTYNVDTETFTLNNPTKTGYTFKGWTGANGNTAQTSVSVTKGSTDNKAYTANWTANAYSVVYDANGGSGTMTNSNHIYDTASTLTENTFTRTGYSFKGWSTTKGGNVEYADKASVSTLTATANGSVTLYAVWSSNPYEYTIVYNSNSGIQLGTDTITKEFGTTNTVAPKAFMGYTSPASQNIVWDALSKTITFTYTPIEYTITYNLNGGTVNTANPVEYTIETATFTLNNPSKTGYTFSGWTGSNGSTPSTSVSITKGSTGNKTYTANWSVNTYSVVYNANGGSGTMANSSHTYGTASALTVNKFTRTGYTFKGWSTTKGGSVEYADKASVSTLTATANGSVTLYAVWEANGYSYNIVYVSKSGVQLGTGSVSNKFGTTATVSPKDFTGYTKPASQSVTWDATSKTITFTYTPIEYSITYTLNGGTVATANPTKYTIETATFSLPTPTRSGYIFNGWYETADFSTAQVTEIVHGSTGNKTFYAKWTTANLDLNYGDDGSVGGVVPPAEEPATPPEIPESELPEFIDFTYGEFESNTSYTPGTYETVEYTETYTRTKYPVLYRNFVWSQWLVTNNTIYEPFEISLSDIDEKYSEYIVYNFETDDAIVLEGVAGDSVELWTIYNESEDNIDNIVYLAAYLNKANGTTNHHIAKWDGNKYVDVDYDEEISAVTTFTETYTVTNTKQVTVTAPSTSTEYVFIPTNTMKAEAGMTWNEWLISSYNTTGISDSSSAVLKNSDYEDISWDSVIQAGESYAITEIILEPGLYDDNDVMIASWDALVNTYGMDVEKNYTYSNYKTDTASPYYVLTNNSALSSGTQLIIGEGITKIGEYAFSYYTGLTSVTIPDSVTNIGNGAFYNCIGLTSVTIPNPVTSIGGYAFYNCTGLTSVTIPDSVTSIGSNAFTGCTGLMSINVDENNNQYCSVDGVLYSKNKTIIIRYPQGKIGTTFTIPDSVTSIDSIAFCDCTGLTSVTIPDSVTSIGSAAFSRCTGLTSVTIPDSVTSIGINAFTSCTGLTSVTIPDSVTSIDNYVFSNCTGLTSVTIPASVTSINYGAFFNCTGLTSVTIPASVTSIGNSVFNGCTGLTSVTIPASVTSIGSSAFNGCTGLTSVTIPASVTSIGSSAFNGCTGLTSVYHMHTTAPTWGYYAFSKSSGSKTTFYFKNSTVANAFTIIYYSSSYGTKSTNYTWTAPASLSLRDEPVDDNTAYWRPIVNQMLEGETEIALDGTITEMPMDVIDAVSSMDNPVTFTWNDKDFIITQETINDFEYVSGELVPISELAESYAVEESDSTVNNENTRILNTLRNTFSLLNRSARASGPAAGTNPLGWNLGPDPTVGYPSVGTVSAKTTAVARVTGTLRQLFKTDTDVDYTGYKVVVIDKNGVEYEVATNREGKYTVSNIPPLPSEKLIAKVYKADGTQVTEYGGIYCILADDAWNNSMTVTLQLEEGYISPIQNNTIYEEEDCTFVLEYPSEELPSNLTWYYHDNDVTKWKPITELQAKGLKINTTKPVLVEGEPTMVRATMTLSDVDIKYTNTNFKAVVTVDGKVKDTFDSRREGYAGLLLVNERPWAIYPIKDMAIWQGDDFQFTAQLTHYKGFKSEGGDLIAKWQYNTGTDEGWYDLENSAFFDDIEITNKSTKDPAIPENFYNLSTLKVKNARAVINGFKFRCVYVYEDKDRNYYTSDVSVPGYEGKITVDPLSISCVESPKRIELVTNGANAEGEYEFTAKFKFTSPDGKVDVNWFFKPNQEGDWQDLSESPYYSCMKVETSDPVIADEEQFTYVVTTKLILTNPPIDIDSDDIHYYFKATASNRGISATSRSGDMVFRYTIDIIPNEPVKDITDAGNLTVYTYPNLKVFAVHGLTKFSVQFSKTTGTDKMTNDMPFTGITKLSNGKGFTYSGSKVTAKEVEEWLRNMEFSITSDEIDILWTIEDEIKSGENASSFENNMYEIITIPLSDDPAISYAEAEAMAKAIGREYGTEVKLVTIDSEEENKFISKLMQEDGADIAWIGNVIDNKNKALLWSNDSTSFAAQTANVNYSAYDKVQIVFRAYPNIVTQEYNPKGNEEFYLTIDVDDLAEKTAIFDYNDSKYIERSVQLVSGGVKFGNGVLGKTANNAVVVPLRIYGLTEGDFILNPTLLKEVIYNPYNSNTTVDMNNLGVAQNANPSFPHGTKYSEEGVHAYHYQDNGGLLTFYDARKRALMMRNEELGEYGYLATLTSVEEQNEANFSGVGYIGAFLKENSCYWYWLDGPKSETSNPFYKQHHNGSGCSGCSNQLLFGYFPSKSAGRYARSGNRTFLVIGSAVWDEDTDIGGSGYNVEWNSDISMMHTFIIEYAAFDDGYIHADKTAEAKDTVSHKGTAIEIPTPIVTTTEYRTNTSVIISCEITALDNINPDNPASVTFEITNVDGTKETKVYEDVCLPSEESGRAYVEYFTGSKVGEITIDISVSGDIFNDIGRITATVGEVTDNPPPDPAPTDVKPDGFTLTNPTVDTSQTVHKWTSYTCETDGTEWFYTEIDNTAELNVNVAIIPDENSPTANVRNKTMKSGYGLTEIVTPTIKTESSDSILPQTVISYFPEFNYSTYWRLMDKTSNSGVAPVFEFKNNEYSLENNRVHFTPIWFPDGEYKTFVVVRDAWTPVGELKGSYASDAITIDGSLHDDWFTRN